MFESIDWGTLLGVAVFLGLGISIFTYRRNLKKDVKEAKQIVEQNQIREEIRTEEATKLREALTQETVDAFKVEAKDVEVEKIKEEARQEIERVKEKARQQEETIRKEARQQEATKLLVEKEEAEKHHLLTTRAEMMDYHTHCVYLVRCIGESRYKIGKSKNAHVRLKGLNCSQCSHLVDLVAILTCCAWNYEEKEKELHALYAPANIHHEWFELTDAQVEAWPNGLEEE